MIDKEYKNNAHASYYGGKDNPYECIKVIQEWGKQANWTCMDGFYFGTVLRYIYRNGHKEGNSKAQDIQKCINYLQMYVNELEGVKEND